MTTGQVNIFAINRTGLPASLTGGGGFERPIDVIFGTKGEMYIADFGYFSGSGALPSTGVIWKVTKL